MPSIFGFLRHKIGLDENNKGTVPLGLHPGTRIEIKDVPLIFAEAAGSIVKDIKRVDTITQVGYYEFGDQHVFRAYFDNEECFIEVPVKETALATPLHIRIFKTMNEDNANDGLRQFILTGKEDDAPLLGWIQFGFDNNKIIYDRAWDISNNSANYVAPHHSSEELVDSTHHVVQTDIHDMMLYKRGLSNDVTEFLLADWVMQTRPDGQKSEVFRTFIGIDITVADIEILTT